MRIDFWLEMVYLDKMCTLRTSDCEIVIIDVQITQGMIVLACNLAYNERMRYRVQRVGGRRSVQILRELCGGIFAGGGAR